jgi:hypothetical protein
MPTRDMVEDRTYFAKRAEQERDRAAVCEDNAAALVHLRLADEYDRRAQDVAVMPHCATN